MMLTEIYFSILNLYDKMNVTTVNSLSLYELIPFEDSVIESYVNESETIGNNDTL